VNKDTKRYLQLVLNIVAPKLSNTSNEPHHFPCGNWVARRSAFCFRLSDEAQNSDGHAAAYHYTQQQQRASGSCDDRCETAEGRNGRGDTR
jgi:hypothetical protein